jgi:hypothetical protein
VGEVVHLRAQGRIKKLKNGKKKIEQVENKKQLKGAYVFDPSAFDKFSTQETGPGKNQPERFNEAVICEGNGNENVIQKGAKGAVAFDQHFLPAEVTVLARKPVSAAFAGMHNTWLIHNVRLQIWAFLI